MSAALTLFELEPAPCSDHDSPVLFPGWREFVAEVDYCKVCGEVVEIRLACLGVPPKPALAPVPVCARQSKEMLATIEHGRQCHPSGFLM
jgi:hypothetical protein